MPTNYLYYHLLVGCIFIGHINVNNAKFTKSSSHINRLLTLQNKLQQLQEDVSSSLTALQKPLDDDVITFQSSAIEGDFQFLKKELADIIEAPESDGTLQDSGETQLPSNIVGYIRSHNFDTAEEQLKQINNLQEVTKTIAAIYDNNADNFELLARFIESLTDINLIYASVNALQREMVENDHTDPYKSIRLAKVLETKFLNHPVDYFKTEFAQFTYNELKDTIIDSTLDALNDALRTGAYQEMDNLTAAVYRYDPEQWESIIYEFVNANIDNHSKVHDIINNHQFIEQRVSGLSILYWSIQFNHNPESDVIMRIASILKELTSDRRYQELSGTLKDLADKIIENLPTCARNLFFLPAACLWNKGAEVYLTAINSSHTDDSKRRRQKIFSTELSPGSQWYFKKIDNYFVISNRVFEGEYLFAANTKHSSNFRHVLNRKLKNHTKIDERTKWFIELVNDDDYCYFKSSRHNEYLMTSNYYFGNNLRYVFTWIPKTFAGEPQFQWQIRECD